MTVQVQFTRRSAAMIAILGVAAALALAPFTSAGADHQPADKIAVAGSGMEIAGPGERIPLGSGTLRASSPTDLIISVNAECAIWQYLKTVGNDGSRAEAQMKVWVELDGEVIPVASDDTDDPGRVVFCDRAYERVTSLFDDGDATIETYLDTRSAHSFQWITLNVGNGIHTIEAFAEMTTSETGEARSEVAVGKRTLVVEPVKLANDAQI